jgi:hypothetical protein
MIILHSSIVGDIVGIEIADRLCKCLAYMQFSNNAQFLLFLIEK